MPVGKAADRLSLGMVIPRPEKKSAPGERINQGGRKLRRNAMRRLKVSESEWRLLVDLVDGFRRSDYDPDDLQLTTHRLVQLGLIERTQRGIEVSELGHRVRTDAPAFSHGGPRVWTGPAELHQPISETEEEAVSQPLVCPD